MEKLSPLLLASRVSREIGYKFVAQTGTDKGEQWIDLVPDGLIETSSFKIRVVLGWRHFEVLFKPGAFSGELLKAMRLSGSKSKKLFTSVMCQSVEDGAAVKLKSGGRRYEISDDTLWSVEWENVTFRFRVSRFSTDDEVKIDTSLDRISTWTSRMAAAVLVLMPIEEEHENSTLENFPEGSSKKIEVNKYERDPRNRAAAIAIHGCSCIVCGLSMSQIYGEVAEGFIEVHHVTPLATLGDDYEIDPRNDLVPLCPNCHSIAHRRTPPFSVVEMRSLVAGSAVSINQVAEISGVYDDGNGLE